ncbi:MAG: Hpt domain-containing protein, partial [Terriglobales bacterium]
MSDLEIVKEFLVESYENLDRLDRDLIALEKDPGNPEILASVFRTIHTIKGTSGFLAFHQLGAVNPCRGKPAGAAARRPAHAECGDHDRLAGHGGCGAADAGKHRSDGRRGGTQRSGTDRAPDAAAAAEGGSGPGS